MKKFIVTSLTTALMLGIAASAGAKDPPEKKKTPFEKLDTSGDNQISLEEFCVDAKGNALEGKAKEVKEKLFNKYDTDKNGQLSAEEFKAKGAKPKPPKSS